MRNICFNFELKHKNIKLLFKTEMQIKLQKTFSVDVFVIRVLEDNNFLNMDVQRVSHGRGLKLKQLIKPSGSLFLT